MAFGPPGGGGIPAISPTPPFHFPGSRRGQRPFAHSRPSSTARNTPHSRQSQGDKAHSPGQGPLSGEVVVRNKQSQTNGKRMQQKGQWFFGGALKVFISSPPPFLHAFAAVIAPPCNTPAKSSQLAWPWPCSIPPSTCLFTHLCLLSDPLGRPLLDLCCAVSSIVGVGPELLLRDKFSTALGHHLQSHPRPRGDQNDVVGKQLFPHPPPPLPSEYGYLGTYNLEL